MLKFNAVGDAEAHLWAVALMQAILYATEDRRQSFGMPDTNGSAGDGVRIERTFGAGDCVRCKGTLYVGTFWRRYKVSASRRAAFFDPKQHIWDIAALPQTEL